MPALTHGRVVNGFNQYARSITYSKKNAVVRVFVAGNHFNLLNTMSILKVEILLGFAIVKIQKQIEQYL